MTNLRTAAILLFAWTAASPAVDWTAPVEVQHDFKRCVAYRARLDGDFLIIHATLEPGWHTFAMDNKRRADEKLAGRMALGIDAPTEIKLSQGLATAGPWHQTPPKDFSRPELQLFSWGFENEALFVTKVRRTRSGPAQITITGQACTETICKRVEVAIALPATPRTAAPSKVNLKTLVQVR